MFRQPLFRFLKMPLNFSYRREQKFQTLYQSFWRISSNQFLNGVRNFSISTSSTKGIQHVKSVGGGGFGFRPEIEVQDFYQLRDKCLARGILFEDPEFPPTTIPVDNNYTVREWKRPGELVPNPQFFKDGFSRFDVEQGSLGNCWFLATLADLTSSRRLFFQVVPEDQNFEENYCGIFHFRFWQFGRWIDVVIDDRLPVINDRLVFVRSSEPNEFWSPLLEKAYAKLIGSYLALEGGSIGEAMEDFTGGATERHLLDDHPPSNLFEVLLQAHERGSIIGCSTKSDPKIKEANTGEGLILGHAYSITKVALLEKKHQLIRIRNPWGEDTEWKGRWSDGSKEWSFVTEEQKQDLGHICDSDGEFWMCYEDFLNHFGSVEICYLGPDSLSEDHGHKRKWVVSTFQGKWIKGSTAGGCTNYVSFSKNPQYCFTLSEADEGDEEGKCTVIVSLMQNRREKSMHGENEVNFVPMSFDIWPIVHPDSVSKPLDMEYLNHTRTAGAYPMYSSSRGITRRFKLRKGTYCLIPSTYYPDEESEFFLRVITEHEINLEEYGTASK